MRSVTAAAATTATATATAVGAAKAAITAAAAAVAATGAATTTTAAAAEAARRTSLHGTGLIDHHATAAERLAVHAIDCGLRLGIAAHFNKAEAFGAAGVTFHHHFGAGDGAEL